MNSASHMTSFLRQHKSSPYITSPYSTITGTADKPTLFPNAEPAAHESSSNVGSVQNINNWGLIIAIFCLYPLFAIKVAETAFPTQPCSQVDLSPAAADQCEQNNINQQNYQYLAVLLMGAIGAIVAILLGKSKRSSRSAAFGLLYGSFATTIYAVLANYSRLSSTAQVSILALLLAAYIFIPQLTNSILLT